MATVATVQAKLEAAQVRGGYVARAGTIVIVSFSKKAHDYAEQIEAARKALSDAGYAAIIAPNGKLLVAGEAKRTPKPARTVTVRTYTDEERAQMLAEAGRQAAKRDAAVMYRGDKPFSVWASA